MGYGNSFTKTVFSTGTACLLAGFICIVMAGCGDGGGDTGGSSGTGSGGSSSVATLGYTLTGTVVLPDGSSGPGILVLASRVDEGGVSSRQAKVLAAGPSGETAFKQSVKAAGATAAGSFATVTDAWGVYVLTGLDTGTYYIEASRGGLKAKGRGTVSPLAAAVVDLALTPTGGITGYCLLEGAESGSHAGTFVVIKSTDYIGITGDDGSFTISQVPVGSYQVSFMHRSYESADYPEPVQVPAASAVPLDPVSLIQYLGGTVSGTASAQDQQPIGEVMVTLTGEDGEERFSITGEDGHYEIGGVKPGSYTAGFKHDLIADIFIEEDVTVAEGETVTVNVALTDEKAPVWESAPGVVYVTEIDMATVNGGGSVNPDSGDIAVAVEFGRCLDASCPLTIVVYHNTVEEWDPENWDNNFSSQYGEADIYDGIRGECGCIFEELLPGGRYVFGVRVKDRHGNLEYNRSEYLYVPGDPGGTTAEERENLLTAVGCIGIGTKDPQGILHVESESGSAFVVDGTTGNVGIGTTDPHAALTVGSVDQQQAGTSSTSGTFAVDSNGNVIEGAWQGDPIADDYIESVSSTKITGLISDDSIESVSSSKITGLITDSGIESVSSSKITGTITGASVEGDITSNAAGVTGVVPVASGGTGATTAEQARTNLGIDSLTSTVSGGPGGSIEDGTITADDIAAGAVTDAEISATAAIAGTKIAPDFGTQNIITMGKVGISTSEPKADLHVVGTVIMGPAFGATAEAGMVQFDGTGFKGYDGQEWKALDSQGTAGMTWGDITGTLADQTDLQGELDGLQGDIDSQQGTLDTHQSDIDSLQTSVSGKEAALTTGATTEYYRGDKTWQSLTSTAVTEGDNLYFTQGRFDSSLAGKTSDDLTEGSVNRYFTQSGFDAAFGDKQTGDLSDVTLTSPGDGQILKYSASTSRWENWTPDFQAGTAWGGITGTLSSQTDLQGELDDFQGDIDSLQGTLDTHQSDIDSLQTSVSGKEAALTAGATTEYFRGDKTWQPLTTTAVAEGDNLYYTQDRFDASLARKTADDIIKGSTNQYFTQTAFDTAFSVKQTSDLSDVALKSPGDGQILKYSASKSQWENWTPDFQAGTAWGGITGTLSSQTDLQGELDGFQGDIDSLQTAVDGKEAALTAGVTTEYFRGDKTWQPLTTTAVAEGDNLYFTQTRFDAALAGKTTDNLTEGSTNKYFTSGEFDTSFAAKTTDDLAAGTTNLYSPWNIGDGILTCESSVGIGTANPANKLTVVTTSNNDGLSLVNNAGYNTYIRFYEGASVKSSIAHGGASDMLKLMCMDTGSITLNDGMTEVMRVQDGNVGIGTETPADKLHVEGGLVLGTTTGTNAGTIRFNGGTFEGYTGSEWKALDVQPTGSAGGWTEGTGIVTLTTAGDNVGIGTADPGSYKLKVAGTVFLGATVEIAAGSTMDGRDLSADGTKLDGIEAGADVTNPTTVSEAGAVMSDAIGSDVQAFDAALQSIAGLTTAADQMLYSTGSDTFAVTPLSTAGRALIDDADAATQRATLGLGTASTAEVSEFMAATADNWVNTTGDTMTGTLTLPANGLVAGTDQLVISSGNVGIGTTSPAQKLHVNGAVKIGSYTLPATDGDADQVLATDGSGAVSWATPTGGSSLWTESGSDVYRSGGNVGIGTTSPAQKLHVNGAVKIGAYTLPATDGSADQVLVTDGSGAVSWSTAGTGSSLWTESGSDVYRSGGNVGIGTTEPLTVLGIGVDNSVTGTVTTSADLGSNAISLDGPGGTPNCKSGIMASFDISTLGVASGLVFGRQGDEWGTFVAIHTHPDDTASLTAFPERMRIDMNGNVGVGTTAPAQKLHVDGAVKIGEYTLPSTDGDADQVLQTDGSGTLAWTTVSGGGTPTNILTGDTSVATTDTGTDGTIALKTDNTERMRITNAGNVGIGLTSPGAKMHIKNAAAEASTGQEVLRLQASTLETVVGSGPFLSFYGNDSALTGKIHSLTEANAQVGLAFSTYNSGLVERMRITHAGKVGIGNPNPTAKLEIVGADASNIIEALRLDNADVTGKGCKIVFYQSGTPTETARIATFYDGAKWSMRLGCHDTWEMLTLASPGNVGISATHPESKLQIGMPFATESVGSVPVLRVLGDVQSQTSQTMLRLNRPVDSSVYYSGGADFNVYAYGASVGSFIPQTQLDIALKSAGNLIETANVTVMSLRDNGNVGIGTTVPAQKLHVNGAVKIGEYTLPSTDGDADQVLQTDGSGTLAWATVSGGGTPTNILTGDTSVATTDTGSDGTIAFKTDNAEAMRIDKDGNVGIGTTSPAYDLHVNGDIITEASLGVHGWITLDSTNNEALLIRKDGDAGDIFTVDTTTPKVVVHSGNVGIGSTTPSTALDVNGTVTATAFAGDGSALTDLPASTATSILTNDTSVATTDTGTDGTIAFKTDNSERMRITNAGKIGIGTTAPGALFEVQGTTGGDMVHITSDSGNLCMRLGQPGIAATANALIGWDDSANQLQMYVSGATAGDALNIGSNSKIGIGTTSPAEKLHVRGAGATRLRIENTDTLEAAVQLSTPSSSYKWVAGGSSNIFHLYDLNATVERMTVTSTGKVGIGSASPSTVLDVNGTVTATAFAGDGSALTSLPGGSNILTGDTSVVTTDTGTDGTIAFKTDNAEQMRIDKDGNVGIGITSPGSRLQVVGATMDNSASALNVTNSNWGSLLYVRNDGSVGIGTTAPGELLDVTGNVALRAQGELKLKDSDSSHYVALKSPAIVAANVAWTMPAADGTADQVLSTDGSGALSWATAGGASEFNELSDAISDGSSMFLGSGSGANDDGTANKNVAVGIDTLTANTTGYQNVAAGYTTLASNTTGNNNVAMGYRALNANTDGYSNVAVGNDTLKTGTSTNYNTALGYSALSAATSGSNNTAVGAVALTALTTGGSNVAVGRNSMQYNTSGSNNVGVGYYALRNNTSALGNVGVGPSAGHNNQTGYKNVFVGNAAGYSALGAYNVFIGSKAGYGEEGSNKLYIDSSNDDASTPLIYGEFDNEVLTVNGDLQLKDGTAAGNISIYEASGDGTNKVTIQSQAMAADYALTLPAADGSDGQVLSTNGSGILSWGTVGGTQALINADDSKVEVTDTTTDGTIKFTTENAERMRITNAGLVGIGTNDPGFKLEVSGAQLAIHGTSADTAGTWLRLTNADTGGAYWDFVSTASGNGEGAGKLLIRRNSSAKMIVDTAGNVGIGTTAPGALLEVKGSSDAAQLIVKANVTQSNTSPLVKLQKSDGTDLVWLHSDNPANTFLGLNAGRANTVTGTGSEGLYNTFIGSGSGYSNTTAYYNTAVGFESMKSVTTGYKNTAIGYQSLHSAAGDSNVAIGVQSLLNNTGNNNIAIGSFTLVLNTSGGNNIAIGEQAMTYNKTGMNNLAIGIGALFGVDGTNGGHYNVGIGESTNRQNQTGSRNTIIGYKAGYGSAAHSKDGSVFIGYQAGYNEITSDKLYIDNSNTASPLIYGDFASDILAVNGSVGIGTTGPAANLHVYGSGADIISRVETDAANEAQVHLISGTKTWRIWARDSDDEFGIYDSTTRLRINPVDGYLTLMESSGKVGIGTNAPEGLLSVHNPSGAPGLYITGATETEGDIVTEDGEAIQIGHWNSTSDTFTERMRISSNGYVGIGRTSAANILEVEGTASKSTAGDWAANSDVRIKTDIRDIEDALDVIARLHPVSFRYTDEYRSDHPSIEDRAYYNFIAQEYREVFPYSVKDSGENGYLQVDAYNVKPYLVAGVQELIDAMKEQEAQLEEKQTKIEALEAQNAEILSRLEALETR